MSEVRLHVVDETKSHNSKKERNVTIATIQLSSVIGGENKNGVEEKEVPERAETLIRNAASAGADVVLLPELFSLPYFLMDTSSRHCLLAKPLKDHPLVLQMSQLAKELGIVIPVSIFEAFNNCFFSSVCMIDSDGTQLEGVYRKSHLQENEKKILTPGDTGFKVWQTSKGKIGVGIGYDQFFPEAARGMCLEGAEILLFPTAIGSENHNDDISSPSISSIGSFRWEKITQGQAVANVCPVVVSNRIGKEFSVLNEKYSITFDCASFILDESGEILQEMDNYSEGFIMHTFDLQRIFETRVRSGFFRDRRPELYSSLCTYAGGEKPNFSCPSNASHISSIPSQLASSNQSTSTPGTSVCDNLSANKPRLLTSDLNPTNFRMPAEWEPHASCWIGYPETTENWPEEAKPAQQCFTAFCKAISKYERVNLCVSSSELWPEVAALFDVDSNVRVIELSQDDCWFRDQAPTFVVPRAPSERTTTTEGLPPVVGVCWQFDGYAGVIGEVKHDNMIASKICRIENVPSFHPNVVLEGGSIHVDGLGTMLTTEQCLLKKNVMGRLRNPQLSKKDYEELFERYLGVKKVLWVPSGIHSDFVTNGHVDNLCCFLKPGVVALHWADKEEDAVQHLISQEAFDYLSGETDALGQRLEIVKILRPRQLLRRENECSPPSGVSEIVDEQKSTPGQPIPASYINFFMANGAAFVPQFGDSERDQLAVDVLQAHLPDRKVIGMPAREVIVGGGCFHCITMQEPAKFSEH